MRQALNYAVDKAHALRILAGTAEVAHGLLPPGMLGRDDALAPYPHDPAAARRCSPRPATATASTSSYVTYGGDEPERLAQSLQADLAEVGVRARIVTMSFAAYAAAIGRPDGPPLALAAWQGDSPDPTSFLDAKLATSAIGTTRRRTTRSTRTRRSTRCSTPRAPSPTPPSRAAVPARRAHRVRRRAVDLRVPPPRDRGMQPYLMGYDPHPVWIHDYTTAWLDKPEGD